MHLNKALSETFIRYLHHHQKPSVTVSFPYFYCAPTADWTVLDEVKVKVKEGFLARTWQELALGDEMNGGEGEREEGGGCLARSMYEYAG